MLKHFPLRTTWFFVICFQFLNLHCSHFSLCGKSEPVFETADVLLSLVLDHENIVIFCLRLSWSHVFHNDIVEHEQKLQT